MRHWSSKFGFLMASLGAAVGLGNLWKFPYVCGQSGGAAFIALFILCSLFLGLPLLLAEFVVGGLGRGNSVSALSTLSTQYNRSKAWKIVGLVGTANLLMIMSFYSVIAGWALVYLWHAVMNQFKDLVATESHELFLQMMSSPKIMLIGHTLFTLMTAIVIFSGVRRGIERASKVMMPLLFLILILLVGYNTTLDGFGDAVAFLFTPDFSKITGKVVLDAVGQSFFSLAAGSGCMCLYAAYQADSSSITNQSLFIVFSNITIAILAGLAVFPIVFSYDLNPENGEMLIFQSLPLALGSIPYGYAIGVALFTSFIFAALTSSISLIEPPVAYFEQTGKMARRPALALMTFISWGLGAIYIMLMGGAHDIFGRVIDITSNFILPLTGLGFVLFVGYGIPFEKTLAYLGLEESPYVPWLRRCLRILAPLALISIFIWQVVT